MMILMLSRKVRRGACRRAPVRACPCKLHCQATLCPVESAAPALARASALAPATAPATVPCVRTDAGVCMCAVCMQVDEARAVFARRERIGEPVGGELHGKTLGVVGMGKIGSCLAEAARGLGMQVRAWQGAGGGRWEGWRGVASSQVRKDSM